MLERILLASVFVSVPALAHAQVQITDPIGGAEYTKILDDMHTAVSQWQVAEEKIKDVDRRIADLKRRNDAHNARPCVNPPNQYVCAQFDEEARTLVTEREQLVAEKVALLQTQQYTRSHYQVVMGRLRIAAFLGCLQPFRDEIVSCSNIADPLEAESCMKDVWANHCR
jgi:hypothetical protein